MGSDTAGNKAVFYIVGIGQAKVLGGSDVAKEVRSVNGGNCPANSTYNMVVSGGRICGERTEYIKRCIVDQKNRNPLKTKELRFKFVVPEGLEPPTSWAVTRCSIQLSYGIVAFDSFLKCGANIGKILFVLQSESVKNVDFFHRGATLQKQF